jgi:hypothetical protein
MVSPVEKNGGEVAAVGEGVLRAAAQGGAVAFASEASFGGGEGAAPLSQYVASRSKAGWASMNLTPPLLSGTYAAPADPDPYLLFANDLSRGVLSGGWACRGGGECEAEGPPLGPGGPVGYRNAYLREGSTYTPLITAANFGSLPPEAKEFELAIEGGSPGLEHVVLKADSGLYEWSEGAPEVELISATPGATLAAPEGAVSEDGSRVYFTEAGGLYLRDGGISALLCEACQFGAASGDGSIAFYLKSAHLYRYDAGTEATTDLTPAGGAAAVIATSLDGSYLFYAATDGLYRWHAGIATKLFASVPSKLPPQSGPAALAAGGDRLFFTSPSALVGSGDTNGRPDAYEWEAQGTGSCAKAPGCLGLLSSGRSGEASFAAASASGDDAYFLTAVSLLPADTGATDLYDARVGGGFSEPQPGIECQGDDCQGPPFVPADPPVATATVSGPENPPLSSQRARCPKGKHKVTRHGKSRCVARHHRKAKHGSAR